MSKVEIFFEGLGIPRARRRDFYRAAFVGIMLGHVAWGFNAFALLGFPSTISAGEKEMAATIDAKISDALKPITAKQDEQGKQLDRMNELLTVQILQSIGRDIREAVRRTCTTSGREQDQALEEKERLQSAYKNIANERFVEPTCGQLR